MRKEQFSKRLNKFCHTTENIMTLVLVFGALSMWVYGASMAISTSVDKYKQRLSTKTKPDTTVKTDTVLNLRDIGVKYSSSKNAIDFALATQMQDSLEQRN